MAGKQILVAAASCAFLLLLTTVLVAESRYLAEGEATPSFELVSVQGGRGENVAVFSGAAKGTDADYPRNASVTQSMAKPEADYHDCYEVCCWKADPKCPYPFCNYEQEPCIPNGK